MNNKAECYLHQIAVAVPERSLSADESVALLEGTCISPRSTKLLRRISRLTTVEKRHLAVLDRQTTLTDESALYRPTDRQPHGPDMYARTLEFDVSADKLVRRLMSMLEPATLARIDTLVTVSCTHASSPGLERPVFAHTSVPRSVDRWNLGFMGCSAALAGVRLVLQGATTTREALLVACELSSLHFQYTDQIDQMTANMLFSDGAAAAVLSGRPSPVRVRDCRCVTLPGYADQMVWQAGNHGLQLRLSPELPETLAAHLPQAVRTLLRSNSMQTGDVDHWLVHPGGPQILDSVAESLALREGALDVSRSVLRQYGNMSSPTILFILKQLLDNGASGSVVAIAFGPGLTVELALLHVEEAACPR